MADGIEVRIYKKGSPGTETTTQEAGTKASEPGKPTATQKQVNTLLINYGKQTLQEGYKLITDFTGDYVLANKIDGALNLAADITTIAFGGWVGAIAVAYKRTTQIVESEIAIARERNRINATKQMLGEITQLGGRYTNA